MVSSVMDYASMLFNWLSFDPPYTTCGNVRATLTFNFLLDISSFKACSAGLDLNYLGGERQPLTLQNLVIL